MGGIQNTMSIPIYRVLPYPVIPIAVETLGAFGTQARTFFRKVYSSPGEFGHDDPLAHQFLVQRISVAVRRGNAAAVLGCIGGANSS